MASLHRICLRFSIRRIHRTGYHVENFSYENALVSELRKHTLLFYIKQWLGRPLAIL